MFSIKKSPAVLNAVSRVMKRSKSEVDVGSPPITMSSFELHSRTSEMGSRRCQLALVSS